MTLHVLRKIAKDEAAVIQRADKSLSSVQNVLVLAYILSDG